jgi:bifunctional non-homologous end joining protein LigD
VVVATSPPHLQAEIPPGQYGAGTVRIWDRRTYEAEKWTDGEIKVVLRGSRAAGRYALIHTGGNQWLMHRMGPPAPVPG